MGPWHYVEGNFSPTMWVPRMKLRSLGLEASSETFTHGAISLGPVRTSVYLILKKGNFCINKVFHML